MIKFQWDPAKAESNIKKHGVTFEKAKSVFHDEFTLQFYNEDNSLLEEDRLLMLGSSIESRILLICHCERDCRQVVRIISARKATKAEQKHYKGG